MIPVKFNDTDNYEYMFIRGIPGVYTEEHIDEKTLPDGFYKYSLWGSAPEKIEAVFHCPIAEDHRVGEFISKLPLSVRAGQSMPLGREDVIHTDQQFDMEGFFGMKDSIDLQINKAEGKRENMAGVGPERSHGHSHDEDILL